MTTRTASRPATTMPSRSRRRRAAGAAVGAVVAVIAVTGVVANGVLATTEGETPRSPVVVTHVAAPTPAGAQTIQVTIPDLQAQVRALGAAAPYDLRRAACHQQTGTDDESVEPLATCVAAIPSDAPRP